MQQAVIEADPKKAMDNDRIDKFYCNKFWGYVIPLGVLAICFKVFSGWQHTQWMLLNGYSAHSANGSQVYYHKTGLAILL